VALKASTKPGVPGGNSLYMHDATCRCVPRTAGRERRGPMGTSGSRQVIRGYIQKFPDWPPGARTGNGIQLSATRCTCIAVLLVSLVSFAAKTLCVASQRVFIVVISLSTQSGNFCIYRTLSSTLIATVRYLPYEFSVDGGRPVEFALCASVCDRVR
jgi:hypothetical protein